MNLTTENVYSASPLRYNGIMPMRRCGNSGLTLPVLSLGFWWNFGAIDSLQLSKEKMLHAFDNGIFCFDLANNYGPPFGTAEETFGTVYAKNLKTYREELVITTKAGYDMYEGPNGRGSSRRMLITSLEQSLKRMGLEYVDIFYSHRYDADTPLEETLTALEHIVRSGKAIYVGLSNYPADVLRTALDFLRSNRIPCVIYQGRHNLLSRLNEDTVVPVLKEYGLGYTPFSPLAKGLLSDKYLTGVPTDSRAFLGKHFDASELNPQRLSQIGALNEIAANRGQSLAQMSLSWLMAMETVTSVIIGPRTMDQLNDSIAAAAKIEFSPEEITMINTITQ